MYWPRSQDIAILNQLKPNLPVYWGISEAEASGLFVVIYLIITNPHDSTDMMIQTVLAELSKMKFSIDTSSSIFCIL